jgi:hypothetical protein
MLEKKQKGFHCALDFCCELDSKLNQIRTVFEPRLVIYHFLVFFEVVAVHLGDPVHQSVVVRTHLSWKDFVPYYQLLTQENRNIWGFHGSFLLKWADSGQEVAGYDVQVVVHDKDGTQLLESPNFLVNFIVLNVEQLAVDRVVDE